MNPLTKQCLDTLPALERGAETSPPCKICDGVCTLFDSVDFNKHCALDPYQFGLSGIAVRYYRCEQCSFIFTDFFDDWSTEEFSKYIYNEDYIKVDPEYVGARAIRIAQALAKFLEGSEALKLLDYGSGSGAFSEEMRRNGFKNVEGYDPYSSPREPNGPYDLITCFEVMEHSPQPLKTLREMAEKLSRCGAIFVGQSFQPINIEEVRGRWWYVAPRNGHVSFFAEETFITLANRLNLIYHRGPGFYGFTRSRNNDSVLNAVKKLGPPIHLKTLLAPDPASLAPGWHDAERRVSTIFRWTATAETSWPEIDLQSGITLIHIPFLMEICDGFLKDSVITVDGKKIPTRIERRRIIGEVSNLRPRTCRVSLCTAPLLTPFDLRGINDKRLLGLAVANWSTMV